MSTPSTIGERRHSICPSCPDVRAEAISLKFESGVKTVTYRCPACGHTWEYIGPQLKRDTVKLQAG